VIAGCARSADTYSHVAPTLAEQAADDLAGLILAQPRTDCGAIPPFAKCLQTAAASR